MPRSIGAIRRLLGALLVVALSTMFMLDAVSAHEHREVGEYELTVGFLNEPAIVEEPNGLDLRVQMGHGDAGVPVEGLAGSLRAEIIYGDERLPLEIRPVFGEPGAYKADVIPTETGAYTFHIFGSIEGMDIDESFTGGLDTFAEVASRQTMNFPNQVSSVGSVQTMASDANDTASTAMLLGVGGLVTGLLGLVFGGMAFARTQSRRPESSTAISGVSQDASD
ncbi:MAG: hypothetical protein H0V47_04580 [Chloroflexia bacterium]|nr:hypothetical protein [Chloroflexia bacterium]